MAKKMLPLVELLAGLAEECAELAQAALKLRRVFDGTNYAPISEGAAINRFEEEIADVMLYLSQIDYSKVHVQQVMEQKQERWERRLSQE